MDDKTYQEILDGLQNPLAIGREEIEEIPSYFPGDDAWRSESEAPNDLRWCGPPLHVKLSDIPTVYQPLYREFLEQLESKHYFRERRTFMTGAEIKAYVLQRWPDVYIPLEMHHAFLNRIGSDYRAPVNQKWCEYLDETLEDVKQDAKFSGWARRSSLRNLFALENGETPTERFERLYDELHRNLRRVTGNLNFGDIRSLLQQPSRETFKSLYYVIKNLPDEDETYSKTLPYIRQALRAWPDETRYLDMSPDDTTFQRLDGMVLFWDCDSVNMMKRFFEGLMSDVTMGVSVHNCYCLPYDEVVDYEAAYPNLRLYHQSGGSPRGELNLNAVKSGKGLKALLKLDRVNYRGRPKRGPHPPRRQYQQMKSFDEAIQEVVRENDTEATG